MRHFAAFSLIASLLTTAAASAPWIDDKGRFLVMQFPGSPSDNFKAAGHDVTTAATLFKSACLDTNLDRAEAGMKAEASGWGFAYRPVTVPFKNPVELGGWMATDAALNVGKDLFFNKHAQCGLTVAVTGPSDSAAAESAMVALLGAQPANASKALDGKGQRKKFYEPQWNMSDPSTGDVTTIYVRSLAGSNGQIQFAALRKAKK